MKIRVELCDSGKNDGGYRIERHFKNLVECVFCLGCGISNLIKDPVEFAFEVSSVLAAMSFLKEKYLRRGAVGFFGLTVLWAIYFGSFRLFVQAHLTTSMRGGVTTTYVAIPNTKLNRFAVGVYAPLLDHHFPAGAPIEWY